MTEIDKCHVHDEAEDSVRDEVREKVCVPNSDFNLKDHLGKKYCLFHLPTEDKDNGNGIDLFKDTFYKKLDDVESDPNLTQSHDFRYVWFPSRIYLTGKTLKAPTCFRWATFTRIVSCKSVTFKAMADFRSATFLAKADFENAIFEGEAFFGWANFSADVRFVKSKFCANRETFFNETTFGNTTVFDDAEFSNDVSFNSAIFGKDSDVFFLRSEFKGNVDFQYCIAQGYLRFNNVKGDGFRLDFQDAAFDTAARISFHTMPLERHWFVNIDVRKYSFTEIDWPDGDAAIWGKKHIDYELLKLDGRDKRDLNKRLYEIVVRELAGRADRHRFSFTYAEQKSLTYLKPGIEISLVAPVSVENCFSFGENEYLYEIDVYKILAQANKNRYAFSEVEWRFLSSYLQDREESREELARLNERKKKEQPRHLLEIAVRQLAENAEANNRYDEASKFRYMAMETKLLEKVTLRDWRKFPVLIRLYKWSSRYGESWRWALVILLIILFIPSIFYITPWANFEMPEKKQLVILHDNEIDTNREGNQTKYYQMNNFEGLVHSLFVAALQRPEPRAADTPTRAIVILETIFAPLQAALLALAIRRKFMR